MLMFIRIELYKIFTRKRSYIGFGAILVIISLTFMAVQWEGQQVLNLFTQGITKSFNLQGNLVNGYTVSYLVMNFLWVHIPLLIVIVTGDLLSGEANSGTLRVILTRPVSRFQLVTAKFKAGMIYSFVMVLFLALLSFGGGLLLFGKGDLVVMGGTLNIFPKEDIIWRFGMAYLFAFLSMATITSLSILLSAMANNSLGPILSTMAVIIILTLISSIGFHVFDLMKPFIFTTYLNTWQKFFSFDVKWNEIIRNAVVLLGHIILFYWITLIYFKRKDILS
jgi:ABC-2 type transport system permease protein